MKKLLSGLIILLLLVGCGIQTSVDVTEIDAHVERLKQHAETQSDFEQYKADLEEFNNYLKGIDNEKYQEYIEVQIEANNMRIEGIEEMDSDLITESSFKQAHALDILEQIKEAQ